jgi:hypothetical protein
MWFLNLWNYLWEEFGLWATVSLKVCKSLMGSSEDLNGNRNADGEGHIYEISEGNKESAGNWISGHLYYILVKNLLTFCPCPKTMIKAVFKDH